MKENKNVDTTKTTTHLGLCAGYGGIELGLHRVIRNLRTVALCEIEAFACANLVAKMEEGLMDAAPIWTDLKSFPWAEFRGRVDILTGGYPCQPFSAAGKRLGTEDPRHLWPFIADGIRILRPRLCFFENVEGHISLGLRAVIGELESIGYQTAWGIFSAAEVSAPHQRKRVFILAYDKSQRIQGHWADWLQESRPHAGQGLPLRGGDAGTNATAWPSRPGQPQYAWEPPRVVANGNGRGQRECGKQDRVEIGLNYQASRRNNTCGCNETMGNTNSPRSQERQGQRGAGIQGTHADGGADAERQTQPSLGRDLNGAAGGMGYAELCISCDNRTDELRLLGNGVVPATAERAFRVLMEEINRPIS
jgi:DNA (cytosine-5)-methyltransferase 1